MPKHFMAICEVARLTLPFDDAYEYLETQMDKTQARSDRASEKGKDEKAGKYEECLDQLTSFQNSLEELAGRVAASAPHHLRKLRPLPVRRGLFAI